MICKLELREFVPSRLTLLTLTWVVVVAARFCAADPRVGNWKLVAADSTLDPPRVLSIKPQGKGVHVVMSGGVHFDFTAGWDGHDNHVQNIPAFNQIVMRRIDKNQTEIKEKKNGALVATLYDKMSGDRKEFTTTTVQQGHEDQITVWERSGGVACLLVISSAAPVYDCQFVSYSNVSPLRHYVPPYCNIAVSRWVAGFVCFSCAYNSA